MLMCSRCHKRMAVVFITKLENGEKKNEGVCMTCGADLNDGPCGCEKEIDPRWAGLFD